MPASARAATVRFGEDSVTARNPGFSGRHPTGLRALTQSGENLETSVTVGRIHADFFLEGDDRLDGVAAGAAVDAVGLEALFVEPALDLLDLGQRRDAFA